MLAVNKAAQEMIKEVRRQFHEIPGILEGTAEADFKKCVEVSTKHSLKEMLLPGGLTVLVPLIVGFGLGSKCITGMLVGSITNGYLLGVLMSNAGGAWDNAKKYVEHGLLEGQTKGSLTHKACITGDTIGDPFKDTSGPSLNILIKLMTRFAFVLAVVFKPDTT